MTLAGRWATLVMACMLSCLVVAPAVANDDTGAEFTLLWNERKPNAKGPLAMAQVLLPGIAPPTPSGLRVSAELRHTLRAPAGLALHGTALLAHEQLEGQAARDDSHVNELHAALDLGAWQLSAGKRVLGWDVGYAFRPNDVVQQEERRALYQRTPEGRPLLQLEHFSANTAWSLVWAQPQRWSDPADEQRGALESAWATRAYLRSGSLDLHLFGRYGRHTGGSGGAAIAWVATDELELHGSARAMQRHDGWQFRQSTTVASANPWRQATLGGAGQWLVGAQWTGEQRLSMLAEYWYDGTALGDAQWDGWTYRNGALAAAAGAGAPAQAVAANLAWQASALQAPSLRRHNLFLRGAWQEGPWQLALDALVMPADRGRVVTAALQWQADRLRLNASWRTYGGPASALASLLPLRHSVLLAANIAY